MSSRPSISPLTTDVCAVKRKKKKHEEKSLETASLDTAKSKRRKESALTPQEEAEKAAPPKRIMHGATEVSSRKKTDTEERARREQ